MIPRGQDQRESEGESKRTAGVRAGVDVRRGLQQLLHYQLHCIPSLLELWNGDAEGAKKQPAEVRMNREGGTTTQTELL